MLADALEVVASAQRVCLTQLIELGMSSKGRHEAVTTVWRNPGASQEKKEPGKASNFAEMKD